jgi:hypothetical protein
LPSSSISRKREPKRPKTRRHGQAKVAMEATVLKNERMTKSK